MEAHNIILNDYQPDRNTESMSEFKKDEYNLILKLKRRADKAFKEGKFEKAYNLYNQALQFDQNDYDIIACLIGASLNLGFIDEVFEKANLLIQMDPSKAQGYYLRGIANDVVFKFDIAIDSFITALEYESQHSNIIIKNLVKTLTKFINKEESIQLDELIDLNDELENFLKLLELTDQLLKKRSNNQIVLKILNYLQNLEIDNYHFKIELLLLSGKYFKNEKNYDKALMMFEECFYLANLNQDNKLKIKTIVSISSCYLELSDLHKVIYYYHKLIDVEAHLLSKNSSINENMINLELRVAIRQNLFTAHYKLGKLRISCYYLNEIIEIIDKDLNLNEALNVEADSFDFIQIKIDASLELIKLYYIFEEFLKMKILLDNILKFIEDILDKTNFNILTKKQINSLIYFKIKCYSQMGICLAGLREFRLSKLSTRKSLCLIDNESEKCEDEESKHYLNTIKIECLLDSTEACNQIIKTFKETKEYMFNLNKKNEHTFEAYEINLLSESYQSRINSSKSAYLLSKTVIDPNLRAQTTFMTALSLYQNEFYQSAAYYFNEVLSIPAVLLDKQLTDNRFYTDATPDYRLEASVYLYKCHLMIDYYELDSIIKISLEQREDGFKIEKIEYETLYKKLMKIIEILIKHYLKWKLHETNRSSFLFNQSNLNFLKYDCDSLRLKNLIKICSECLIYTCYKLDKKEECLIYMELEYFLLNSTLNDLVDLNLIDMQNEFNFSALSFENFLKLLNQTVNFLLRYKFIFDSKLLFVFILEPNRKDFFFSKIKLSHVLNKYELDKDILMLYNSKLNYYLKKIDLIQNEWVKKNLNLIELKSVSNSKSELFQVRIKNRFKERNLLNHFISEDSNYLFKFNFESIDLLNLKLSDKLKEGSSLELVDLSSIKTDTIQSEQITNMVLNLNEIFFKIVLEPVLGKLNETKINCLNILIDTEYSKMFVYTFNLYNQAQENKIYYLILLDTFLKYSNKLVNSLEKDVQEEIDFTKQKQEIVIEPNRTKTLSNKLDSTNLDRVHKSLIIPRYTSNPRQATNLLNENKDSNYVLLRNDHVQRFKNRLDSSISVLITETLSGTNSKRSNLEIIEYKQVNKQYRCCVIGCPDIPNMLNFNSKLKNDFEQIVEIGKLLNIEPIFSTKMTKQEVLYQFENSNLIYFSSLSSNESDSILICSQSNEYPSSYYEFDKYCKITSEDLDLIDMHKCNLLILNVYSSLSNKPRYELVKKFLSRGCKCILMVLSPLVDNLMLKFYMEFFGFLKNEIQIEKAFNQSILKLKILNPELDQFILNSAFGLIGAKSFRISINELNRSMVQLNVDKTLEKIKQEFNIDYLNPEPNFSILSPDFVNSLEKTLIQLQVLIKLLLNQLIRDSETINFINNKNYVGIFSSLNDLISKSIFNMKSNKIGPEPLNEFLYENSNSQNLLKCLGFSIQRENVYTIRDEKDKKCILFPDLRYLDLNVRLSHVMGSLINLCFKLDINESEQLRIKSIIFNLESLLPIDDKNLLKCLIEIIALTKFSPEIILNLTDYTVYYALNYYEYLNTNKNRKYLDLIEKDLLEWNLSFEKNLNKQIEISPSDLSVKYSINNKVVNFLLSIGYEIIGTWLRFNDSYSNQNILDLILKFFTSFTTDRDMSLYKEMNINVLGQRSAVTRGLIRTASNLNKEDLKAKKDQMFKLNVTNPWASVETQKEMEKKIEFSEKYANLSKKICNQRKDALNHHMNYVMKQSTLNKNPEGIDKASSNKKIKFKPGGTPSRDRIIENERRDLTYEQVNEIRKYSHLLTRKNIEKIDLELKEKSQKLMLPLINKK